MIRLEDPAAAPPRPDLGFLKRRSRPRAQARPASVAPAASPPVSPVADFVAGRAPHPHHPPAPAVPPLDFSRPAREHAAPAPAASSPLDLSRPATPAPAPASSSPLDLSRPATPARAPASSSLDLSAAPAAPPPPVAGSARPAAPRHRRHRDARVRAGQHHLLKITSPTVTLTRAQSGIGQLDIEAVCSPEVGDLRLGAAYQLADGTSSTVQYTGGNRFAPSARRPVIVAGRDGYEHLRVDLRQVPSLERLAVYAFSESRSELSWGGTLIVTTFGGARIELPLESLFAGRVAVLMSIYNFDGELVIRAEMETIAGDVREAARAYGYDRITWRDDRNPVDA